VGRAVRGESSAKSEEEEGSATSEEEEGSALRSARTDEIMLKMITAAKISNKFSRESPYISNTFSRESPKFQTSFQRSKRSPRHSKDLSGKLIDLEIEIFQV